MSRPTPPTYKTKNWPAYNEALKRRGSLSIWFDPEMSWNGAATLSMARHYSRSANLAAKNRETMATLETENARRAQVVKPSAKSVKSKPKGASE